MKIYILPVDIKFRPKSTIIKYPAHNKDYGVEQDFLNFILKNEHLVTHNVKVADWHYLPVYWNRYYVNHAYGKSGWEELQQEVDKCIIDDRRTFTICQNYRVLSVNLGQTTIFSATRTNGKVIDIPLLCSPHRVPLAYKIPFFKPPKKYLASFVGRLKTHPIRQEIAEQLINREDVYVFDGDKGSKFFVKIMFESYISLCPRGDVPTSYRFFEAMQLETVPFLIADLDIRPFKKFIDWDEVSFFSDSVSDLKSRLDSLKKSDLLPMGRRAGNLYSGKLAYQKWCQYVMRGLEEMRIQPRP